MPQKLRPLGKVLHVLENNEIIAIIEDPQSIPRKGTKVVLKTMKWLGTTTNVFGPVSKPYIGVIPHQSFKDFTTLKPGEPLFVFTEHTKPKQRVKQTQKTKTKTKTKQQKKGAPTKNNKKRFQKR